MPNQYHNFNNQNLESHILFYGEQACQPDEYFEGNNLRKNDVLYYIMSGKGTFTSSGHHSVKLNIRLSKVAQMLATTIPLPKNN